VSILNDILLVSLSEFITLHLSDNGSLTIISVSTPRSSSNRAPLWRKISATEFIANHLVLGGDFNHLEEVSCKGLAG
jgi:hypothetical protein